jgi:hypothetical protein
MAGCASQEFQEFGSVICFSHDFQLRILLDDLPYALAYHDMVIGLDDVTAGH